MGGVSVYLRDGERQPPPTILLAELVGSLSIALDMTEGQPDGHSIRCCWIGVQIGKALNLDEHAISDLYFTLLLKDLGCSSNAARICETYLTDDISFKSDFKTIDDSLIAALRFVFIKTGTSSKLSARINAILNILKNGRAISRSLIETRCSQGAEIAAKMRFSKEVQDGIFSLDEHWDGTGKPNALKENEIPINSNIALLSQVIDIFYTEKGKKAAIDEVRKRSGRWFSPKLVEAFEVAQTSLDFWERLDDSDLYQHVFQMEPGEKKVNVDEDYIDDIVSAFSDVVDAKSPFTANHSNRVAYYANLIAEELNLDASHRRWLRRAALLHDLGKLAVSNQILDKAGKLNADEWRVIRAHPTHSERILERISLFKGIASVAGAHHERLDGHGYNRGQTAPDISLEARILTVADVFDALIADRPYRSAMPVQEALSVLERDIGTAFDQDCVEALKCGLARQPHGAA